MKEITITQGNEGQRIDKFLMKLLPGMSKSFCYKMFRKKNVKLNGLKIQGDEHLKENDIIKVFFSDETYEKFSGPSIKEDLAEIALPEVVYEDACLLVLNKASGIFSQNDVKGVSITQQIEAYYRHKSEKLELGVKVGVSNRLDCNTSGIVLSGKTLPMIQAINNAIKNHDVQKLYRTIVVGEIQSPMTLKGYLVKDPSTNTVTIQNEAYKPSNDTDSASYIHTILRPLRSSSRYTELEVEIKTGKSHQIRAHLASIHHPIIGDAKYGDEKVNKQMRRDYGLRHQLLHAQSYQFLSKEPLFEAYTKPFTALIPELYYAIAKDVL